jgi:hypothetical protein
VQLRQRPRAEQRLHGHGVAILHRMTARFGRRAHTGAAQRGATQRAATVGAGAPRDAVAYFTTLYVAPNMWEAVSTKEAGWARKADFG